MVKIRSGLLIVLALLLVALVGTLRSTEARAGVGQPGIVLFSAGTPGTEAGEPDAGQGKTTPPPKASSTGKPDAKKVRRSLGAARMDWFRSARGIWAARYLGMGY